MAVSRADRRRDRRDRVVQRFGHDLADSVLDLLELVELAWHDCYGDVSPPEAVIDDILLCSDGKPASLMKAARLAVEDVRDLRVWADSKR